MAEPSTMALFWAGVIAASILIYVILDGFDLGVGILSGTAPTRSLRDRMIAATPLGRIAGADELAATVQFLASDASAFVTGQILSVDGGRSLGDPLSPGVF